MSQLYDREGNRKYLTASERAAFLDAAQTLSPEVRTFCLVLAYTGARISEVLSLTPERIDTATRVIIIESLKKRQRGRFRAVPVPGELLADLEQVHELAAIQQNALLAKLRIYKWCRTTAWNHVKNCMALAHITPGPRACPKGLRHSFGVGAIQSGVPINFVKKWLGHARLSTTEIYIDAVGDEERAIATRFWKSF